MKLFATFSIICLVSGQIFWSKKSDVEDFKDPYDYGADVTFPIHHYIKKDTFFKRRYDKWMQDCYKAYSQRECDATERARLEMSMEQPAKHHNYTELGFKKMKVPEALFKEIRSFWDANKEKGETIEQWPRGNTYVNAWEVPSYMVNLENKQLRGGWDLKQRVWNELNPILSEWIGGKKLEPTSLYGIRVYKRNAYLATHVDRLPLVTSCILQVDQDVEEPWPVEIYSHDGKAYNITLEPGEMALYESHTTLHGRPFPLNGTYYANVFVHFKPVDYDSLNEQEQAQLLSHSKLPGAQKVTGVTDPVYNKKQGGHEHDQHDEDTLKRHMADIDKEHNTNANDKTGGNGSGGGGGVDGRTALHEAAGEGNIERVEKLLNNAHTEMLHVQDINGWQAIHEAVRSGSIEVVRYLVDMGADIGAKTNTGGTVLWWAKKLLSENHEIIVYLQSIGAPDDGGDFDGIDIEVEEGGGSEEGEPDEEEGE